MDLNPSSILQEGNRPEPRLTVSPVQPSPCLGYMLICLFRENISFDSVVLLTWDNQTHLWPTVSFLVMNANGTTPSNWTYDGTFWWNSWNLVDVPNTGFYEWQIDDAPVQFALGVKALRIFPSSGMTLYLIG